MFSLNKMYIGLKYGNNRSYILSWQGYLISYILLYVVFLFSQDFLLGKSLSQRDIFITWHEATGN